MDPVTITPVAVQYVNGQAEYYSENQWSRLTKRVDKDADRSDFEAAFQLAGIKVTKWWSLANQYWPNTAEYFEVSLNWFLVKTEHGLIEIGRRKRVIQIDWSETDIRKKVTEDDVTQTDTMVHAYTIEKAIEYLKALVTQQKPFVP